MISRRGFFSAILASTAAAATLDVEKLLWVPGEKTIFLPPAQRFSGNTFVTPEWVVQEVLDMFENQLKSANLFNWQYFELFAQEASA